MAAPPFMQPPLLGWRPSGAANIADTASTTSKAISSHILNALGITATSHLEGQEAGRLLEEEVTKFLSTELPKLDPSRNWKVERRRLISQFDQYSHLARLQALINADTSRTLSTEIGTDYLIKPDVVVSIPSTHGGEFQHAAIPCKWTIRSDRVQNIRHEGIILTRHRRGRQPHIATVTPEPMPTRLAAIARGTGEVDAVYHLLFDELVAATKAVGTRDQKDVLDELIKQDRVRSFAELAPTLVL
jgi:hypothetical protein